MILVYEYKKEIIQEDFDVTEIKNHNICKAVEKINKGKEYVYEVSLCQRWMKMSTKF